MAAFNMEIAGAVGRIDALFETTAVYFKNYLTRRPADFSFAPTPEDLRREQEWLDAEAQEEGLRRRAFTEPFLERAVIQRAFADHLFYRDTLLLHGSTVAVDGAAYLFTAPCGTGKSTHTRLWRQIFGARAVMINDDKPFLAIREDGVTAYGTPWSGKHGLDTNMAAPLKGICILSRGAENRIRPLAAEDGLEFLIRQCHCPETPDAKIQLRDLVSRLTDAVPLWQMECNRDTEAARVAYEAMKQAGD